VIDDRSDHPGLALCHLVDKEIGEGENDSDLIDVAPEAKQR
jgi:hypothetical protein